MARAEALTVTLSTKGQLALPKAIRRRRHWDAGTRIVVEDTPQGVLLQSAPMFKRTRPQEVFGSVKPAGPPKSLAQMEAGVLAEARRRHARD